MLILGLGTSHLQSSFSTKGVMPIFNIQVHIGVSLCSKMCHSRITDYKCALELFHSDSKVKLFGRALLMKDLGKIYQML